MPGPPRRALRLLAAVPLATAASSGLGLLASPELVAGVWSASPAANLAFVVGTAATLALLQRLAGAPRLALAAVAAGFTALTYALAWELAAPGMESGQLRVTMGPETSAVAAVLVVGAPGLVVWACAAAPVARWLAGLPAPERAPPPPA